MTTAPERPLEELDLQADPGPAGQVGRPVLRYGGGDRSSGAQRFVADLAFPGAAQVALVTIRSIRPRSLCQLAVEQWIV